MKGAKRLNDATIYNKRVCIYDIRDKETTESGRVLKWYEFFVDGKLEGRLLARNKKELIGYIAEYIKKKSAKQFYREAYAGKYGG